MDEAAVAVLGTLGGTIVGALLGLTIEGRRQRHEDESRWHTQRFDRYATVLRTADEYLLAMRGYFTQTSFLDELNTDPLSTLWPSRPERRSLDQACREAELVASWKGFAYPRLQSLRDLAGRFPESQFWNGEPINKDEWQKAIGWFDGGIRAFEQAAKTELGIYRPGERRRARLPLYPGRDDAMRRDD